MSGLLIGIGVGMGLFALYALALVITYVWRELWNLPVGRRHRVNERIRKLDGEGHPR